jgi:hypothetical protein
LPSTHITDLCNTETKTNDEAANDEECNMEADASKSDTDKHNRAANDDTDAPASDIGDVWRSRDSKNTANEHDTNDKTKDSRFGVIEC